VSRARLEGVAGRAAVAGALLLGGCSSSTGPGAAASLAAGPDAGKKVHDAAPPSTGAVDGAGGCTDGTTGFPAGAVCITHVDGRALDEQGNAVKSKTLVSACGPAQCNPGFTDDTGHFDIPVGLHLDPRIYSAQVHVRPDQAAFYYPLPKAATGPIVHLGDLRVLPMPASGPALDVNRAGVPAQSVTSGDVTLDVPGGVYVRLDVESNRAAALGKEFRALTIPDAFLKDFVDPGLGVKALYAFEPFEASFETATTPATQVNVRLSFANTSKMAPGTPIDVLALGSYIYPDWIPAAAFAKVAKGHVSADGSRVDLDPGEGLPYLTWVAVRPTP
jgi:hypothetical protein